MRLIGKVLGPHHRRLYTWLNSNIHQMNIHVTVPNLINICQEYHMCEMELLHENINPSRRDINSRINSYVRRNPNCSVDTIISGIERRDPLYLNQFVYKDFSRRNYHEFCQWYALQHRASNIGLNVVNLQSSGQSTVHLSDNGRISSFDDMRPNDNAYTKSIDFIIEYRESSPSHSPRRQSERNIKREYICAKWTGQGGGSQDNQREDARNFLRSASKNMNSNQYFTLVVDGPYYKNKSNMQKLQDAISPQAEKWVRITSADDWDSVLS